MPPGSDSVGGGLDLIDAPWIGTTILYNPWPQGNGFAPVQYAQNVGAAELLQVEWSADLQGRLHQLDVKNGAATVHMPVFQPVIDAHWAHVEGIDYAGAKDQGTSAFFRSAGSVDDFKEFVRLVPGLYSFAAPRETEELPITKEEREKGKILADALVKVNVDRKLTEVRWYENNAQPSVSHYTLDGSSCVTLTPDADGRKYVIKEVKAVERSKDGKTTHVFAWSDGSWKKKRDELRASRVKVDQSIDKASGDPQVYDWRPEWKSPGDIK
jgi:hypothetical protein